MASPQQRAEKDATSCSCVRVQMEKDISETTEDDEDLPSAAFEGNSCPELMARYPVLTLLSFAGHGYRPVPQCVGSRG